MKFDTPKIIIPNGRFEVDEREALWLTNAEQTRMAFYVNVADGVFFSMTHCAGNSPAFETCFLSGSFEELFEHVCNVHAGMTVRSNKLKMAIPVDKENCIFAKETV